MAWWWFVPAVPLLVALIAWCALALIRRSRGPAATLDRAVAELEAALRRAGRPAAAGTTLQQLEPSSAARRRRRPTCMPCAPAATRQRSAPDTERPPRAAPRARARSRPRGGCARSGRCRRGGLGPRRAARRAGARRLVAGWGARAGWGGARGGLRRIARRLRPATSRRRYALVKDASSAGRLRADVAPRYASAAPTPTPPSRAARAHPASAARRDCWRISDRIRSRRGSAESSTWDIAAATAGWRSAISACIWWATAR